ncbi:LysR family transcriptional regulator [Paraburkholderia sp.]|uniref:LysR family transcriptional regulator n=1 Tax=Paraburkholderia sp. TaxID=1926495 RepID=UPI002382DD2E|nr:LysR family transcriptional regulator [Paraburkholderia sp.]MDE1183432.1 LysR family transcriptional regulator [Paraburkholderia sp.]
MNQIHAMRVFVRVAENESFRRAAQQLDVSNALVTRSIATLEAHLQTRLINRTTRNLSLTEAGVHFLEGCRGLLEELEHLESTVTHSEREPGGTLRVVAFGALPLMALTPLLDGYRKLYPKVKIRLTLSERHIDLLEDGYDVGIVPASTVASRELVERPLTTNAMVACASPAYLEDNGTPTTPTELAEHGFVGLPQEQRSSLWHFNAPDGESSQVALVPVYTVNNTMMVRLAALAGMGVAMLPLTMVADDFAEGTLTRIMTNYQADDPESKVSIVYPSRQYLPSKTRSFIDYTVEYFGQDVVPEIKPQPSIPTPAVFTRTFAAHGR